MKLTINSVGRDVEVEYLELVKYAESREYLPKGFWLTGEWNEIVMEKARINAELGRLKRELSKLKVE